jgi:hypothetical protein
LEVELTYRYSFAFKFTLRFQQPDIVPIIATGVTETGGKLQPDVVDTGGKFVDTGCAHWLANISANFKKIRNGPKGILWGWGETDSWKKTRSKKSYDTIPLREVLHCRSMSNAFSLQNSYAQSQFHPTHQVSIDLHRKLIHKKLYSFIFLRSARAFKKVLVLEDPHSNDLLKI